MFARGGHGFGMVQQGLPSDRWTDLFLAWLDDLGESAQRPSAAERTGVAARARRDVDQLPRLSQGDLVPDALGNDDGVACTELDGSIAVGELETRNSSSDVFVRSVSSVRARAGSFGGMGSPRPPRAKKTSEPSSGVR